MTAAPPDAIDHRRSSRPRRRRPARQETGGTSRAEPARTSGDRELVPRVPAAVMPGGAGRRAARPDGRHVTEELSRRTAPPVAGELRCRPSAADGRRRHRSKDPHRGSLPATPGFRSSHGRRGACSARLRHPLAALRLSLARRHGSGAEWRGDIARTVHNAWGRSLDGMPAGPGGRAEGRSAPALVFHVEHEVDVPPARTMLPRGQLAADSAL